MRAFELFVAKDSRDAVALLAKHSASSKVRVIAGGTDLLADLKFSPHSPNVVVDISRAEDLKSITLTDDGLQHRRAGHALPDHEVAGDPRDVSGLGRCRAHHRRRADAESGHAGRQSGDRRSVHG